MKSMECGIQLKTHGWSKSLWRWTRRTGRSISLRPHDATLKIFLLWWIRRQKHIVGHLGIYQSSMFSGRNVNRKLVWETYPKQAEMKAKPNGCRGKTFHESNKNICTSESVCLSVFWSLPVFRVCSLVPPPTVGLSTSPRPRQTPKALEQWSAGPSCQAGGRKSTEAATGLELFRNWRRSRAWGEALPKLLVVKIRWTNGRRACEIKLSSKIPRNFHSKKKAKKWSLIGRKMGKTFYSGAETKNRFDFNLFASQKWGTVIFEGTVCKTW